MAGLGLSGSLVCAIVFECVQKLGLKLAIGGFERSFFVALRFEVGLQRAVVAALRFEVGLQRFVFRLQRFVFRLQRVVVAALRFEFVLQVAVEVAQVLKLDRRRLFFGRLLSSQSVFLRDQVQFGAARKPEERRFNVAATGVEILHVVFLVERHMFFFDLVVYADFDANEHDWNVSTNTLQRVVQLLNFSVRTAASDVEQENGAVGTLQVLVDHVNLGHFPHVVSD